MSCLNPIRIKGKDGQLMDVPCGRCYGCLNRRSRYAYTLCKLEALKHEYCFFLTLTYNKDFLPVIRLNQFMEYVGCVDEPIEIFDFEITQKRMKKFYGVDKIDSLSSESIPHYVLEEYLLPFKNDAFKLENTNEFSILYRRDLINFFKRLRFHLNKELKKDDKKEEPVCLRYYGVGEYGPKSLRPHYHAIVFLDDQEAARIFPHCVFKSWKYGIYDCQLSDSGKAIGYVAKYVNSFSFVPKILNLPWSKPFSVHSQNFGVSPDEDAYKELAELEFGRIGAREYQVDGRLKSVDAPFSLQSALFPKCYAYGVSNHSLNLVRYQFSTILYEEMCRRGAEAEACSVREMAGYFVNNKIELCNGRYSIDDLFPRCKSEDIVQTVQSALYLSNKFLRLCDRYNTSPWYYYYRVIVPWYSDRELNYLNKSLLKMEEDFQRSSCSPLNLVHRYSNIPLLTDFSLDELARMDCSFSFLALQHFADSIGVSVDDVLMVAGDKTQDSFAPYQYYLQAKIFRDNQKHKELNDKNFVLYSPNEFYRLKKDLHEF